MASRLVCVIAVSATALTAALALHLSAAGLETGTARSSAQAPAKGDARPRAGTPRPRSAAALAVRVAPPVTLPVDSPWALPPVLVLHARAGGRATPALRRWVLHLRRLALSPPARRSVQRGTASAGALKMLAAFPRTSGPLLVLSVDGRRVRAQETTLWMTRQALRGVPAMPARL